MKTIAVLYKDLMWLNDNKTNNYQWCQEHLVWLHIEEETNHMMICRNIISAKIVLITSN